MRNVFNLNPSPLANAFRKNILIKNKHYPLNIYLCLDCKHLQLVNIINPKILFSNYLYSSGASQVYIDHLKKYSDSLIIKYDLNNKSYTNMNSCQNYNDTSNYTFTAPKTGKYFFIDKRKIKRR